MKIVLLFALAVVAAAAAPCCVPEQLEMDMARYDEELHRRSVDRFYYDFKNKMSLMEIEEPMKMSMLARYDKKIAYTWDHANKTCHKIPLEHEMEEFCVYAEAKMATKATIGDGWVVDIWAAHEEKHFYEATVTQADCIPISIMEHGREPGIEHMAFWNPVKGIKDPSVFDVPSFC